MFLPFGHFDDFLHFDFFFILWFLGLSLLRGKDFVIVQMIVLPDFSQKKIVMYSWANNLLNIEK